MNRLIVVSNRVTLAQPSSAGGLAIALNAALAQRGGLWMGWSGQQTDDKAPAPLAISTVGKITYALTDLTQKDLEEYYQGFANRVLWPICHYRLDLAEYERKEMSGYFRVNRFFAERLASLVQEGDLVWVHDYHLIPLAAELRRAGLRNRLGFFLHIPWPPPDVFFAMPVHAEILKSLCSYDVVGFQTKYDVENFLGCLQRSGLARHVGGIITTTEGKSLRVGAYPIGIDTARFSTLAAQSATSRPLRKAAESLRGRDLIVGADRLDYSKGITQRIDAFERFIRSEKHMQGKVTYLQITPKSRSEVPEYEAMQRVVAEQAGRVNGELGTLDWVPIRYINRSVPHNLLSGLYRLSKVGLVTPLRDGMNLVAKEYVAAQSEDDPGVLVLSAFAGAARELDGAIKVNPYDVEGIAQALSTALTMSLEERRGRWRSMYDHLLEHDVQHWCEWFLDDLEGPPLQ
ncbi:alpha,alpha-trehalose-phosphate synthase (UDP-forming) [Ensifer sp. NM-2]|uniref:alpha,alpha-trehalose-phosphate synthase (UDP-forming) n=1 Tax=unclassified Ensifer TaxID=2633371 RepID=UPI00070AFE13|nr:MULTISPECIES: alpha,alpha-trehalose-phosphate synthase (UDP-forming) [unclassified Ensifer]KQW55581.1 alpha,alpha-trehalose-phosphate synthase [Ensifer sp. Root127]PSS64375.1 alpha,alpha-trehalose-phosphate synthase (UDP-forming) [Ensifer sp. NM-2]